VALMLFGGECWAGKTCHESKNGKDAFHRPNSFPVESRLTRNAGKSCSQDAHASVITRPLSPAATRIISAAVFWWEEFMKRPYSIATWGLKGISWFDSKARGPVRRLVDEMHARLRTTRLTALAVVVVGLAATDAIASAPIP